MTLTEDATNPATYDPTAWRYEFNAWWPRLGGIPDRLLASKDFSESYTMRRAHAFRIREGRYALVIESGCSCYSAEEAEIYIYGDKKSVMADFKTWSEAEDKWLVEPTGVKAE